MEEQARQGASKGAGIKFISGRGRGEGLTFAPARGPRQAYSTTELESQALATFSHNEAIIHEHNSGNWTFTLGHNQFSDLTFEEFQQKHMAGGMARFISGKGCAVGKLQRSNRLACGGDQEHDAASSASMTLLTTQ